MNEINKFYQDAMDRRKRTKELRIYFAKQQFEKTRDFAGKHGLFLKQINDNHYQVTSGRFLIDIYPGEQRLDADPNQHPRMDVERPWNLMIIVKEFINTFQQI